MDNNMESSLSAAMHGAPDADRYVFFTRPRCPLCGGCELRVNGTVDQGDGSLRRYLVCREENCRHRFIGIFE